MADRAGRRANGFDIEPVTWVDPVTLADDDVPEQEWLWKDWIPMRAVTLLAGDGGVGKSLLAVQLATACVTGRPFLGKDVRRVKALVLACEDEEAVLRRRQRQINRQLGITNADLDGLRWWPRAGLNSTMMEFVGEGGGEPTEFYRQVRAMVLEEGFQLVVIDTSADVFAGNENVRSQVKQFIGAGLTTIALEGNAAVVLLSHPSQLGRSSGTGESGSTGWNNSVRSRLYFARPEKKEGEPVDDTARILSLQKSNYSASGVKVAMRWKDGAFTFTADHDANGGLADPEQLRKAAMAMLRGVQELAAKGIAVSSYKNQASYAPKEVLAKTRHGAGFSLADLGGALDRLINDGRLTYVGTNKNNKGGTLAVVEPIGDLDRF